MTCTNNPCPLRAMCEKGNNESKTGEFFEYTTLKGHDNNGNIRYTYGCREFEKKKDMYQICDEVYGKIQPTEKEVC